MDEFEMEIREISLQSARGRKQIDAFLARSGLVRDDLDYYAGVFAYGRLVAGGGYAGRTIKCVAVDEDLRAEGFSSRIITRLYTCLVETGADNVFVFTKPENTGIFRSLGFRTVGEAPAAILMESSRRGLPRYLEALAATRRDGRCAASVVNCNPFTLGHQYLIETAAARCDHLHLFIVSEDRSVFPYEVRRALIEEGTAHIRNLTLHDGGDYIISAQTFPSYFLKEYSERVKTHAALDIDIFARKIAPALGISIRYAGEEPLDPVTAVYNAAMQEILPRHGIELAVIARKTLDGQPISASQVRQLIAEDRLTDTRPLVPETTYEFLCSPEAAPILEKIRRTAPRKE